MKKPELLSPAGDMECLKYAIEAGCDAVYLGGKLFGARAFSKNFTDEEMVEAIKYAHLYGVKVYVTMNTLIYENEVERFLNYVEFLYKNNVDAIIVQDIGMMDLIRKTFPLLEIHASTQMHIHNLSGVKLVEKLGIKRAVLARETSIDTIEEIKKNTNVELEIFVHGALCISYSGQCLMSSLIGHRSGNRGSCAGSCRQKYNLISDGKRVNQDEYLLSTKDLNSLENIGKLMDIDVDSIKIEGRMKSPSYVYMVTRLYRKAIDSYYENGKVEINLDELEQLKSIFNREYTKGFLGNADNNDITNSKRPNHLGVPIGNVISQEKGFVSIKLTNSLAIKDGIRILDKEDIGFTVTNLFLNRKKVTQAQNGDIISIPLKDKVSIGSTVVKTLDTVLIDDIKRNVEKYSRKVKINGKAYLKIGSPLLFEITDGVNTVKKTGKIVEAALNQPVSLERIREQFNKLGNTIYELENLDIEKDEDIFIGMKDINDIKNNAILELNEKRLYQYEYKREEYKIDLPDFEKKEKYTILIQNESQYNKIKNEDYETIYCDNDINDDRFVKKIDRVINNYPQYNKLLLVGELGSIYKYKEVYTDWSLNVTNSYSVALLHSLGVKRITLSNELNDFHIEELIKSYEKRYNKHPNLELMVFGKEEAMVSKYNLNKTYNVKKSYLEDRFHNLYPIVIKNDLMYIYNYKYTSRIDYQKYYDIGINYLRFSILEDKDILEKDK